MKSQNKTKTSKRKNEEMNEQPSMAELEKHKTAMHF